MIGAGNNKQVCLKWIHIRMSYFSNSTQFAILADKILGEPKIASDPRFDTNAKRVANREELKELITQILSKENRCFWVKKFTGLG